MTKNVMIAGLQRAATGACAAALMAGMVTATPSLAQEAGTQEAGAPDMDAQEQGASPSIGMIDNGAQADADANVRTASAKVNGEIITQTDIDQRVAWIEATTQRRLVPQEREQVVQQLVDELIQIQNAREAEIAITSEEVLQMYDRYAQRELGITSAELDDLTRSVGSSPASLQRMLLAQAAWQQLLRRNVAPLVNVSAREVNEQIERMKADKGTNEYRLGEIYIAAPAGSDAQVEQRMQAIMEQLQETGDFASVAAQYSQASTAARGGDLGFVRLDRLPPELATVVPAMQVGELQGPIPCCGGYSILYMRDKRQVMVADPRDGMVSLAQITINMPAGLSMNEMNQFAADFGQKTQGFTGGCSAVEAEAQKIGAEAVLVNQISIRQLPSQLQEMVLATPDGGVTRPYGVAASEASQPLRAMMVCGRTDPPMLDGPTSDQVMEQIENERIERRAQNYLRDLRRDAIVERN